MINDNYLNKSIYDIPIDSDIVAHLLVKKCKLGPWKLGILSVLFPIIGIAIFLFFAFINHLFNFNSISEVRVRNYWFPIVIWLLFINPIVSYYYLWSFTAIIKVIEKLQEFKVLSSSIYNNDKDFIKKLYWDFYIRSNWRKLAKILAIFVAVVVSIIVVKIQFPNEFPDAVPLPRLVISFLGFIITYSGCITVFNLITNIEILFSLFNQGKIKISPLHPDRCGGLSPLSEYSLKTAYLAAPLGLWVGILEYKIIKGDVPEYFHLVVILYICISFVVFFGSLSVAHQKMKNAKNEQLHRIADQYIDDYPGVYDHLKADLGDLDKKISKLQILRKFYNITDEFPVWPFDTNKIRSYLLSASTPLIPTILNLLKNLIEILSTQLVNHGS